MSNSSVYDITDLPALASFTREIVSSVKPGTVLALQGELGSGKTTFTQHLLKEFGITDPITSPTFTIMNQYVTDNGQIICHLDLYRLKDATELRHIGFEEILNPNNIVIIEWPELASDLLPNETLWIKFSLDDKEKRTVETFYR